MMVSFFANSSSVSDAETAERYVDRLASVPAYLRDLRESLQAGHDQGIRLPASGLDSAAASIRDAVAGPADALPGPALQAFASSGHDSVRGQAERALALIQDEIRPRFPVLRAFLEGPLADGARSTIACTDAPLGRELYRTLVRDFTTTAMSRRRSTISVSPRWLASKPTWRRSPRTPACRRLGRLSRLPGRRPVHCPVKEALRAAGGPVQAHRRPSPDSLRTHPRITYGVESMPEAVAKRLPPAYAQPNPADRSAAGSSGSRACLSAARALAPADGAARGMAGAPHAHRVDAGGRRPAGVPPPRRDPLPGVCGGLGDLLRGPGRRHGAL